MNRLTNEFVLSHIESGFHLDDEHIKFVKDKLEYADKMKAIEEELGIDLITLFKALKNGIYKKGRNNLKGLILYSKMPMFSFYHKTIDAELIEDYRKTWALTRKELENEASI